MQIEIVIPLAGEGKRFAEAGYLEPKPFIDVHGSPMIIQVVRNLLPISDCFTFIVRANHYERMMHLVRDLDINARCVAVEETTQGAVSSVLAAKDFIAHEVPVMIANSDQIVHYDVEAWNEHVSSGHHHSIWVFGPASHPKWSYAKVEDGRIVQVAEKDPISRLATTGHYYWRTWQSYVTAAEEMIYKDIRVNDEFYNCPVYNEAIARGDVVKPFYPIKMYGLGTPEDLRAYLTNS
jgi:dTDP-glucose pyrophosphorylase